MVHVTQDPENTRPRRHRLFDIERDSRHLRDMSEPIHTPAQATAPPGGDPLSAPAALLTDTAREAPGRDDATTETGPSNRVESNRVETNRVESNEVVSSSVLSDTAVSDRPMVVSSNEDPHARLDELGALGYRILYRLLGDRHTATALTHEVLRNVVGRPQPGTIAGADEVTMAWGSVETALRHREQAGRWMSRESASARHRERLCRELRRWDDAGRLILTLRHLAGFDVAVVARLLRVDEGTIRQVTSRWTPEDSVAGSLLDGIDTWVGSRPGGHGTLLSSRGTLQHLDDPDQRPSFAPSSFQGESFSGERHF